MKYRLITHSLLFALFMSIFSAASAVAETNSNLTDLVNTAIKNNPELKSSQARWQMFASKARQAATLEDPMLMFKLQNLVARDPVNFSRDPQTAKVVGISQQIPFWGKRALREEMAQREAESYRWSVEERKLELTRMVKETYYQLWVTDRFLAVVDKNLRIIDDFLAIAESKYSVGQGAQQDIFKAGLEKSRMLDMRISLVQKHRSLEANLNYLLYRPSDTPVAPVMDSGLPELRLSAEQLNTLAAEKRPQLKSLSMLVSKGETAHKLAQKEFYPDFNLSLEYMFREASMNDPGYNMFSVGVTFNLPFQLERRRAMQAESRFEAGMATEELNALKNSISFAVSDTLSQLERRKKMIELYKSGIIPQAEQSLESAVIGYRVNKVDFLTLLDGRLTLFNYERELYDSQAEYMMALARLEAVVGTDLVQQVSAAPAPVPTPEQPSGHSQHH